MTQKCPRCKQETNDYRKCNDCGAEFCWKCLDALGNSGDSKLN